VDGRIAFGETHLFVGRGYVVSVRHGASVSYAAVRQRCEACPTILSQGEDYIVYAILDFIVDNYVPVLERIYSEVEAIEDTVLATTLGQPDIERLYTLRRDLLRLRNAAGPLVEVCVTRSPRLCLRGEPDGRAGAADCDCASAGRLGRYPGRTHRYRRNLRNEFRVHA
jgi:Mg2+ and Co2+ transporter CorA